MFFNYCKFMLLYALKIKYTFNTSAVFYSIFSAACMYHHLKNIVHVLGIVPDCSFA